MATICKICPVSFSDDCFRPPSGIGGFVSFGQEEKVDLMSISASEREDWAGTPRPTATCTLPPSRRCSYSLSARLLCCCDFCPVSAQHTLSLTRYANFVYLSLDAHWFVSTYELRARLASVAIGYRDVYIFAE
ncbi:hypothetical protein QQF64_030066 [Cirrhinus molitorella]|uniref:Uncharacterized protein n=1 Tax=Cirrhinus molitorella TaxID=172907 RepID=A0ABR3N288_9TELE